MQVVLGLGVTLAIVVAALFGVVSPQLKRAFLDIERAQVGRNVDRARSVLATELATLEAIAHDWASWDDTVGFVEGTAAGFVDENLFAETFVNLRLNGMAFFDAAGRLVDARGFDLERNEPVPLSETQMATLGSIVAVGQPADDTSSLAGLLAFGDDLALIGIHPILNSLHELPVRGTLVMMRTLTPTEIGRISVLIQWPLRLRSIEDPRNDPGLLAALSGGDPDQPPSAIVPLNAEIVTGYGMWNDLRGAPVAVLGVEMSRDVYRAGIAALRSQQILFLSMVAVLGVAFLAFLDLRVLARVARLALSVVRIAEGKNPSERATVKGKDELAGLAKNINSMLGSIEESHAALAESERQYRNLFESSRDPIYITSEDGRFIDVNQAFVDLLGHTKEEIMTMKAGETYAHPQDRDAFRVAIQERGFVAGYPVTLKKKDGTHLRCLLTSIMESPSGAAPRVYQGIIRDVTELLRSQEKLSFLATHDPLTGLLTRAALDDVLKLEIARAMRNLERLAVFYLDLDRFKEVNDTHGHAAGDRVLQEVSVRLREALRASDTIARLGGDEFVVLLPGIDNPKDVEIAAEKVLRALRDSFAIEDDGSLDLSASIGIALYPDDADNSTHLLQNADAAMYVAKTEGRDGWRRYDRRPHGPSRS
jgi:diguanylate cyclase (GGDEF)-like protein/PAS domain S-box-containing protein